MSHERRQKIKVHILTPQKVYDVKNIGLDKSNPAVWKLKYIQTDFIIEGEKERSR